MIEKAGLLILGYIFDGLLVGLGSSKFGLLWLIWVVLSKLFRFYRDFTVEDLGLLLIIGLYCGTGRFEVGSIVGDVLSRQALSFKNECWFVVMLRGSRVMVVDFVRALFDSF